MNENYHALADLVELWTVLKEREDDAQTQRRQIEQQIAGLMPPTAPESSISTVVDNYKVAVKYSVSRKVDSDKLQAMWADCGPLVQKAFRWSADINLKELRGLMDFAPEQYLKAAECITTKPASPRITIESLEAKQAA